MSLAVEPLAARPLVLGDRAFAAACFLLASLLAWIFQAPIARDVWTSGVFLDSDDAMRMVQVRDLLAGQSWFDLAQHRLAPPAGASMHWSRLIDVPVAAFVLLFGLVADPTTAERLARLAISSLWQAAFFGVLLVVVLRLAGRAALLPAALAAGLCLVVAPQFAPGRIDHHGAQLVLTLVLVTQILARRPAAPVFAGYVAALMLAIGLETLHLVAVAFLIYGVAWLRGEDEAALPRFAAALGAGVFALFLIGVGPDRWPQPVCDALGLPALAATTLGAAAALGLAAAGARVRTPGARAALALAAGFALVATLALLFPECRRGPLGAIPSDIVARWLVDVAEARSVVAQWRMEPWVVVAMLGAGAVGYGVLLAATALDRARRPAWAALLAFASAALLVSFGQLRGVAFFTALTLPALAWAAARLWERAKPAAAMLMAVGTCPFWGLLAAANLPETRDEARACLATEAVSALRAIAPTTLLAPVDLGAHILALTPHAALGAPYHRNVAGLRASLDAFDGDEASLRRALAATGATHVVVCDGLAELGNAARRAPEGLAAQLLADRPPTWLAPVPLSGPLRAWRTAP
jgi:hypothetical protein